MAYAQTQDAPTEHSTITVQKILPAKGPGKPAWLKDTDGISFGIWPDKLGPVREGETYDVEFISNVREGVTYRNIQQIRVATKPGPAPSQFTASHQPRSLSSAAVQGDAKPNGNGNGYYRPTSPRDAERMFVCSTLNAFISTGRVDCNQQMIAEYINELRAAWGATFGQDSQD